MARITGLGVLLCTGMMTWALPARAGFEFTAPSAAPAKAPQEQAPAMEDDSGEPMSIVPMAAVTAEPLDTPSNNQVLKLPASSGPQPTAAPTPAPASSAEQVYIRRQRDTMAIKPPKNEPMDTAALLKATENGDSIAMTQDRLDDMPAKQTGALVINPYPLEEQATHGNGMGDVPLEQAMMEEGGTLRPVATPGKNMAGLRERARITSRYDSSSQYLPRQRAAASATDDPMMVTSMTPIPGGEGEPLGRIESTPLAPPPVPRAPAPEPIPVQQKQQQSAAQSRPALPDAVKTSSMPRPAIPQDYPTPAQQQPAQQASSTQTNTQGGYAEAVGFGRDLPLALALSQVVPPEYSYAFGQDINVGSTVSWQGGKPWNEVLNEMLAQNGMKAVIQDNQITIVTART